MGGSQSITTGYVYNGSCAQLVCLRPPDVLHALKNGDTVIWVGPIYKTDADGEGKSILITSIGTIHFFWGLPGMTRNSASLLDNLTMDFGAGPVVVKMPQYRNVCYALLIDVSFGTQTVPPTLNWEIGRFTSGLSLDGKIGYVHMLTLGSGGNVLTTTATISGDGTGAIVQPVIADLTSPNVVAGACVRIIIVNPGTGYTSATISFGGPGSGMTGQVFVNHQVDGDCNLVEATYELLTDVLYGGKVDPADIDIDSFVAAANQVASEGLGVSPIMDQSQTIREIIGGWNFYTDGYLTFEGGKIKYNLRRAIPDEALLLLPGEDHLTIADLLEEPVPANPIHKDTWNMTHVSFNDRFNNWEQTGESYDDPAHADMVDRAVEKTFDFPFVTRREVAKKLALRLGSQGGVPVVSWSLRLKPSHEGRAVGSVFYLSYPKLGIVSKLMRITEINRFSPTAPEVEVTVVEENLRDTSNDYVPPNDDLSTLVPTIIGADGGDAFKVLPSQPRCSILPSLLKGGSPDGWLLAVSRPNVVSTRVAESFDYHPLTGATWINQGMHIGFPRIGTIIWCERYRGNWLLRVTVTNSFDLDGLFDLAAATDNIVFVTGQRSVGRTGYNRHELLTLWGHKIPSGRFQLIDAVTFDIEVDFGDYSTPEPAFETLTAHGIVPTTVIYFGRLDEFIVRPTLIYQFERNGGNYSGDTTHTRALRTQIGNARALQSVTDALECSYIQSDLSMNPAGTYTPDWGMRALTGAEYLDVQAGDIVGDGFSDVPYEADLDLLLGKEVDGLETSAEQELTLDSNVVLGNLVTSGDTSVISDTI